MSNFTHSTTDRTSTIRLVHSAVQRALEATVSSSPRTDMMISPPTSGSQVISDRIGKPAAFIVITGQQEDGDQHDDADQHDKGIDGERAGLDLHRLARAIHRELRQPIRHAVDDRGVAGLPEHARQPEHRLHEDRIIEFVEVPFVQQEQIDAAERAPRAASAAAGTHVHDVGERDAEQTDHSRRELDPEPAALRACQHVIVGALKMLPSQNSCQSSPMNQSCSAQPATTAPTASTNSGTSITAGFRAHAPSRDGRRAACHGRS